MEQGRLGSGSRAAGGGGDPQSSVGLSLSELVDAIHLSIAMDAEILARLGLCRRVDTAEYVQTELLPHQKQLLGIPDDVSRTSKKKKRSCSQDSDFHGGADEPSLLKAPPAARLTLQQEGSEGGEERPWCGAAAHAARRLSLSSGSSSSYSSCASGSSSSSGSSASSSSSDESGMKTTRETKRSKGIKKKKKKKRISPSSFINSECNFGKLCDIKAFFDHYPELHDFKKAQARTGLSGGLGAPFTSASRHRSALHSAPIGIGDGGGSSRIQALSLGFYAPPSSTAQRGGASGRRGVPQDAFVSIFGPTLCPNYPRNVAAWFCSVDRESTGIVTWRTFARFLQESCEKIRSESIRGEQLAKTLSYDEMPRMPPQPQPPYRAVKVEQGPLAFYILCSDGHVRELRKDTLRVSHIVHYPDPEDPHPCDVKYAVERSQLFVVLPTGIVFVYDTTGHMTRQGNILRCYRVGESHPYDERGWSRSGGISSMRKTILFDPRHMELPDRGARYTAIPDSISTTCDVYPLSVRPLCVCSNAHSAPSAVAPTPTRTSRLLPRTSVSASSVRRAPCVCEAAPAHAIPPPPIVSCIEPFQLEPGSKDPFFFVGFDSGHVAMHRPPIVCPVVTGPRRPEMLVTPFTTLSGSSRTAGAATTGSLPTRCRVTCMKYCDTFTDLRGLLLSSAMGHISLVDIESHGTVMTFRDTPSSSASSSTGLLDDDDGGGWVDGCRPVTTFDVSRQMAVIASCGYMRGVSLWSATMRRKIATFHDHRGPVRGLCFHQDLYQLISIADDRTIRIWDIRTLKPLQVIVDRERPDVGQPFSEVCYDATQRRVVAWTGAPFAYHVVDTSIASVSAKGLSPVVSVIAVELEAEDEDATASPATNHQEGEGSGIRSSHAAILVASGASLSLWDASTGSLKHLVPVGSVVIDMIYDASGRRAFLAIGDDVIAQYVVGAAHIALKSRLLPPPGDAFATVEPYAVRMRSLALLSHSNPSPSVPSSSTTSTRQQLIVGCEKGRILVYSTQRWGPSIQAAQAINLANLPGAPATIGDVSALMPILPPVASSLNRIHEQEMICMAGSTEGVTAILCRNHRGAMVVTRLHHHRSLLATMVERVEQRGRDRSPTRNDEAGSPSESSLVWSPTRSSSAPLSRSTQQLWRRAVSAAKKESRQLSAKSFTDFRYRAQEQMQVAVERMALLRVAATLPQPNHAGDESGRFDRFAVVLHANGDARIVHVDYEEEEHGRSASVPATNHHQLAAMPPAAIVANIPATSSEGCGGIVVSDPAVPNVFWVADDCGFLTEFHVRRVGRDGRREEEEATRGGGGGGLAMGEMESTKSDLVLSETTCSTATASVLANGPKYYLSSLVAIFVEYVWRFSSGISAIHVAAPSDATKTKRLLLGFESGRPSVVNLDTREVVWGLEALDAQSPRENRLRHRFPMLFPKWDPVLGVSTSTSSGPHAAVAVLSPLVKSVSKLTALHRSIASITPVAAPSSRPPLASTTLSNSSNGREQPQVAMIDREHLLRVAMRQAPTHLRDGALAAIGSDDEGRSVTGPTSSSHLIGSIAKRDRSASSDRSCFSRLALNDVSNHPINLRPSSAAALSASTSRLLPPARARSATRK